jgi:predicted transcriptional regulator
MATKTKRRAKAQHAASKSVRTSVSLPSELHNTLTQLAKAKKVSVAWVIRDAAEKYVGEQWPLFQEGSA